MAVNLPACARLDTITPSGKTLAVACEVWGPAVSGRPTLNVTCDWRAILAPEEVERALSEVVGVPVHLHRGSPPSRYAVEVDRAMARGRRKKCGVAR